MTVIAQEYSEIAGHWWLMPVNLGTQEAEIGGLWFKASPGKVRET
jgi:hypothetical protein